MSNVVWRQPGRAADNQSMNAHRGSACGTLRLAWETGKIRACGGLRWLRPWPGLPLR